MLPHAGHLGLFFVLIFISGSTNGALSAGGNILCLDIWRGHDVGDVWMHSIHFSFAVGTFLGPVLVKPFLTTIAETNATNISGTEINVEEQDFGIETFYAIAGMATATISFGYLILFLISRKDTSRHQELTKKERNKAEYEEVRGSNGKVEYTLYSVMLLFFFFYVGMEVVYGTYLTTFAVSCDLKLSRQQGADITAMFWGAFATMRLVAIILAIKVKPLAFLCLSFGLCCGGSLILSIWGQQSPLVLQIISAVMGVGVAPAFASALLWIEQQVIVTNRLGAALLVASSIGADSLPIILGHFIIDMPMSLMYTVAGVAFASLFAFVLAMILSRKLNQRVK